METELEYLEKRVAALISRITDLTMQNTRFAEALSDALKTNAELNFKVQEARERISSLLERLPKNEDAS